jgi:hypothetical protein
VADRWDDTAIWSGGKRGKHLLERPSGRPGHLGSPWRCSGIAGRLGFQTTSRAVVKTTTSRGKLDQRPQGLSL